MTHQRRRTLFVATGLAALVLSALLAQAEVASFEIGTATYAFDTQSQFLLVLCGGRRVSLGVLTPLFSASGSDAPAPPEVGTVQVVSAEVDAHGVALECKARAGDRTVDYRLRLWAEGDSLLMRVESDSAHGRAVVPAMLEAEEQWRRVDLSQYGLAHGQPWFQKATYDEDSGLWAWAFWRLEAGNAAHWDQRYPDNAGSGPLELAPRAVYEPSVGGQDASLDETLVVRVGEHLWDVVPETANAQSAFREELAQCVFLDFWGAPPASEMARTLEALQRLAGNRVRFYTVVENWQAGGFDALLPDSIRMPDYPPNPAVGTVEALERVCWQGKALGFFAFRTNYQLLRDNSPSFREGRAHPALAADGTPKWHVKPAELAALARRQEAEIAELLHPNAAFTDQLASGGPPSTYLDYGAVPMMREIARLQRSLADDLHRVCRGPLGSETLNAEYLLGRWVDTADFGIMDGHHRLVTPEYKLRRLHGLTTCHGMGLPYRFFELPPFKLFHSGKSPWQDAGLLDDYRCTEILFGNGGYLFMPGTPWRYVAAECLLVGRLQRHYALQPVRDVRYWDDGQWRTLEQLVRDGLVMQTSPFGPQTPAFARVQVVYGNGLHIVVNRAKEPLNVDAGGVGLTLPKSGWAAWGDGLLAYSAFFPGTLHRVDFIEDEAAGVRYLDSRDRRLLDVERPTLWQKADGEYRIAVEVDPAQAF